METKIVHTSKEAVEAFWRGEAFELRLPGMYGRAGCGGLSVRLSDTLKGRGIDAAWPPTSQSSVPVPPVMGFP